MFTDMPLAELRSYRGSSDEPADFDAFWAETLQGARARSTAPTCQPIAHPFTGIEVCDCTFAGWNGEPIRGWLRYPRTDAPLPAIVIYQGYNGGRGFPFEQLMWAEAGYAVINVDTRGQGAGWGFGDTPDHGPTGPAVAGWMTRGVLDPATYYYRRLITDCVLAVDAIATLPMIDPHRVAVMGGSQGGGLSLAVAALNPTVVACAPRVPFLSDYRRATTITDEYPYREITDYLRTHRLDEAAVYRTLSYHDAVNFARRATQPMDMCVGLMDATTPPSTVFATYNNYGGADKTMTVWTHNGHEAGGYEDDLRALRFFARTIGGRAY